jgi:hypothetical protein
VNIKINFSDATSLVLLDTDVSEKSDASVFRLEETWHEDERSSLLKTNVAGFTETLALNRNERLLTSERR